ncbi:MULTISPECIES: VCBS repeat-containing protein [unclassified Streptomyces]|uniref:FG-GAP repeat domain-containing protein n=1 Tax=unclassified Streptomyces TaxID=2593676 RepID=UPI002E0D5EE6|nr:MULTISPECIES: VCBS repeat-containing protein [unclassified Streptomyces]WSR29243.1 VCBS repeat-containing protein [Streptomyces sp. NBC_01205]
MSSLEGVYPHAGGTGTQTLGSRVLIGNGWQTYNTLRLADLNGDGRSDIVGRSPQVSCTSTPTRPAEAR